MVAQDNLLHLQVINKYIIITSACCIQLLDFIYVIIYVQEKWYSSLNNSKNRVSGQMEC